MQLNPSEISELIKKKIENFVHGELEKIVSDVKEPTTKPERVQPVRFFPGRTVPTFLHPVFLPFSCPRGSATLDNTICE